MVSVLNACIPPCPDIDHTFIPGVNRAKKNMNMEVKYINMRVSHSFYRSWSHPYSVLPLVVGDKESFMYSVWRSDVKRCTICTIPTQTHNLRWRCKLVKFPSYEIDIWEWQHKTDYMHSRIRTKTALNHCIDSFLFLFMLIPLCSTKFIQFTSVLECSETNLSYIPSLLRSVNPNDPSQRRARKN